MRRDSARPAIDWLDGLLLGWLTLLCGWYLLRNLGYAVDDSYITFRYAANAAEGNGLVFNLGERHFGSTAMGYAVLLAVLARIGTALGGSPPHGLVPGIATALSALSLLLIGVIWCRIARRMRSRLAYGLVAAILAATLFASFPSNEVAGHETYLFVGLLFLASYLVVYRCAPEPGGVVLALATAVRPDAALFAGLLAGVTGAAGRGWRFPARFAAAYASALAPWLLFLWLYFGSPVPETLIAKRAQILLGYWPAFTMRGALAELAGHLPTTLALLVGATAALRCAWWVLARRRGSSQPSPDALHVAQWVVFSGCLLAAYRLLGVSFWKWYVYPVHFAALYLAIPCVAWLAACAGGSLAQPLAPIARVLGAGLLLAYLALDAGADAHSLRAWAGSRHRSLHLESYDGVVGYLRAHEPDGAVVATPEPGTFGYQLGPRFVVVDQLGLASPGVARAILAGDFALPQRRWDPKYVIRSWPIEELSTELAERYELVAEFPHPYWALYLNRGVFLYAKRGAGSAKQLLAATPVTPVLPGPVMYAIRAVTPRCSFEMIDERRWGTGPESVSADLPVRLNGWAIDAGEMRSPDRLILRFKGAPESLFYAEVSLRIPRPELVERFGSDAYAMAGWQATVDLSGLAPGRYEVGVFVVSGDGEGFCEGGRVLDLERAAAAGPDALSRPGCPSSSPASMARPTGSPAGCSASAWCGPGAASGSRA